MMQKLFLLAVCCFGVADSSASNRAVRVARHLREAAKVTQAEPPQANVTSPRLPESVSSALATGSWRKKPKEDKRKLMDAISQFRAQICADMMKKNGKDFASHDACVEFMKEACHPGKDGVMDGDGKEVTSGKGFCDAYFKADKAVEEIKKEVEEEIVVEAPAPAPSSVPAPAPAKEAPAPAPAPAPAKEAPAPAPAPAKEAPAPAPFRGPAPAPGPMPLPDDEWYYVRDLGKHPSRLHMDEKLKLPTQGFGGKLVEHEDQATATGDWGKEFGPKAGHRTYYQICSEHPENPWCRQQGYYPRKSGTTSSAGLVAFFVPLFLWVCSLL